MYLLFLRTHSRKWPVDCWGGTRYTECDCHNSYAFNTSFVWLHPTTSTTKTVTEILLSCQLFNYPTFLTINERLTIKYGYMTTHCAVCVLIPCCVTIHYWPRVKLSSEYPSIFWPLYSLIPQLWPQQHNILFCRCWGSMCWCQVVTAAGSPRSSSWHGARLATTLQPFNQTCLSHVWRFWTIEEEAIVHRAPGPGCFFCL